MGAIQQDERVQREFKLTTLALKNKNTVYLLSLVIIVFGILSYIRLSKELFPDIVIPTVLVQTPYPGNPPIDIENLITRPLEKEIESIQGIKELRSTSAQGASMIFVEFNTDINLDAALQDVKDAVDRAKSELPDDLSSLGIEPLVMDIDFSEFPIININLSGDYSIEELRGYAEYLEDKIESVSEISKAEIKGVNEREVKINVDHHKMAAMELTFDDIELAVSQENISMSGGEILLGETRRSVRTIGEFESIEQIQNIIIKHEMDKVVYLKDVASVMLGYEDPSSYARLNLQPVVSLQVVKKSGENLLEATDKVFAILDEAKEEHQLPADLNITWTNDQSDMVRMQLSNLENSMILGVIFVVLVLFYFLGTRNALFVGIAIPMSMFLSFIIINVIDYRINMIVLFSLILSLGLLVDNAIVVVENIYRFVHNGYKPFEAAKRAVGEIAMPIIASTATTLAAFLPLAFWGGVTGEFMKNLPITLIIVLTSSLFVAFVITPVLSATFVKRTDTKETNKPNKKKGYRIAFGMIALAVPFYIIGINIVANLLTIFALIGILNLLFFHKAEIWFQNVFLIKLENLYVRSLKFALRGKNPLWFFGGTFLLLILTVMFFMATNPNITFFPDSDPNYINVNVELPIGTDIGATDEFMKKLELDVYKILGRDTNIVESVLTTVGESSDAEFTPGGVGYKAYMTITFVDYEDREDKNTSAIMKELTDELINRYPGVILSFEQDQMGPPAGEPINMEISGEDIEELIHISDSVKNYIEQANIEGIENLKMDLNTGKPELIVNIDRDKARRFGLSTMQIANSIRTFLFGREISDYKMGEDEYPIQLRSEMEYRYSVPALMNQNISFLEEGRVIQVPVSAVADFQYSTTYGSIRRKNMNRVITLYSNVIEGYNATNVNDQIKMVMEEFEMPGGYSYQFTGEQQEQQESMDFLINALLIALALILIILVSQFNSLIRPLIILTSVVFSTIGVFGGIATFSMDFVVVMTGIGIVSLAGIVVNNAIVLIDYIELLKKRKRKELGMADDTFLPMADATECVILGGKTRLRPVLLTAITTILGLLPLAVGVNIDIAGFLNNFDANLYFGGLMVAIWGPISWTVIFGLTFATFLTLVIVPVMYRLTVLAQRRLLHVMEKFKNGNRNNTALAKS
ncbi:MAG: efflux RND transporter permease subunit [bacterium]